MGALTGFERIVRAGEPLAMHTWFQLGGPRQYFAEPETLDELAALVRRCHEEGVPVRLLGEGSNILVRDEGVRGMVVRLSAPAFCRLAIDGRRVTAGGGAVGPRRHRGRPPWPGRPGNADRHSRHRRRRHPRQRRQPLGEHRAMDTPRHGPQPRPANCRNAAATSWDSVTGRAGSRSW